MSTVSSSTEGLGLSIVGVTTTSLLSQCRGGYCKMMSKICLWIFAPQLSLCTVNWIYFTHTSIVNLSYWKTSHKLQILNQLIPVFSLISCFMSSGPTFYCLRLWLPSLLMVSKPILGWFWDLKRRNESEEKEDDLDTTDDRESCQESHGASNQTYLGVKLDLLVFLYLVKGCRVKIDLDELKSWLWNFFSWKGENQTSPNKWIFQLCNKDIKGTPSINCVQKLRAKTGLITYFCVTKKHCNDWFLNIPKVLVPKGISSGSKIDSAPSASVSSKTG